MKIRVIDYKNDGNTVTTRFYEVEEFASGVYLSKDKDSDLYFLIFGNIEKNVYVLDGCYSMETIEANKEYISNIPTDFMKSMLDKSFIRKIDIEFAIQCGFDYQILEKRRNEILDLRKQEEAEKEAIKRQENEEYEQRKAERIKMMLEGLKKGESISFNSLLDIIEKYNIKLAPRTLGAIRKQWGDYKINIQSGQFNRGTAQSTINSIFKVVKDIAGNQ